MSVKNLVSEFVKEAPPYVVGADEQSKSMRPGVTKLLQLATNENPFGTSPKAAEAICQQAPLANRYPDVRAQDLRKKLAEKHGLSVDEVMVTEGATAGLGFIAEVFIQPGDEIILTPPTYPSYYNYVKRCRGKLVEVPLEEDTLTPDFNKVLAAITDKTKAIFLCNPNNPTATLIDSDELHAFQKKLPEHVLLVVDEAYIDFVEDPNYRTMVDAIADDENLIVVRTFSKLYGMAGARMGYLMANREIIEYLQRDSTGFCCSRMGLHAAEAALDDVEFQEMTKKGNQEGREILVSCMKELGFRVWPSHTNFIYFDPGVDVKWFADRLLDYGIIIRGNFKANRISIGTPEEDRFVCKAMREIMANRFLSTRCRRGARPLSGTPAPAERDGSHKNLRQGAQKTRGDSYAIFGICGDPGLCARLCRGRRHGQGRQCGDRQKGLDRRRHGHHHRSR